MKLPKQFVILTFIFCFFQSSFLEAQIVAFQDEQLLFLHPTEDEDFGERMPFIPFDYNQDGITDYVGNDSGLNSQRLYKGISETEFEEIILESKFDDILYTFDFDKDGDEDIVFETIIHINEGNDVFSQIDVLADNSEHIIGVGDFTGDGKTDIISYDQLNASEGVVYMYENFGNSLFLQNEYYRHGNFDRDVDVADINADGFDDVILQFGFTEDNPAVILFGTTGDPVELYLEDNFDWADFSQSIVDIDNDGDLDICMLSRQGDFCILENKDHFESQEAPIIFEFQEDMRYLYFDIADMNNDSNLDLVGVAYSEGERYVYVSTQNSNNQFTTPQRVGLVASPDGGWNTPFSIPHSQGTLSLYDHDGDGLKDIIHTDGYSVPAKVIMFKNESALSTNSEELSFQLSKVYPNPVTDVLYIGNSDFEKGQKISIYDGMGRLVLKTSPDHQALHIKSLKPGTYYAKLEHGQAIPFVKK